MRQAIAGWNDLNAVGFGVIFLAKGWETSVAPELGDRPQAIITRRLLDEADLLIGTFWTRLGTPTGDSPSGTVEEIEEFAESGRPVMLYFADMPAAPSTIDPKQHAAVKAFQAEIQAKGLVGSYETLEELDRKVREDLTRLVWRLGEEGGLSTAPTPGDEGGGGTDGGQAVPVPTRAELVWQHRNRLRGIVTSYEALFSALATGAHQDDARRLMGRFAQDLSEVLAAVDTVLAGRDSEVYVRLFQAVQDASQLARYRFYLDGGASWNRFLEEVRKLFGYLTDLTGKDWTTMLERPSSSPA